MTAISFPVIQKTLIRWADSPKDNWDGGSQVLYNGSGNKMVVLIWEDSAGSGDEADAGKAEDVSGEIMDIIKDDPEVNHLELRYVASDDKDKNLLVLEDGEVKE